MLGQIEILLAFTAVMAAISLVITVCNQTASSLLNLRGLSLRWGLAAAFKSLFPEMKNSPKSPEGAKAFGDHIANAVLVHPLISDSVLPSKHLEHWRVASAIRPDELQRILAVMAIPDKGNSPEVESWTYDDAVSWLSRRAAIMDDWFSAVMDRVSQQFAFYMRISTVVFAAVFVLVFPLDSFKLYKSLSTDVKLRNGVLANIEAIKTAADQLKVTEPETVNTSLKEINTAALVSVAQTLSNPLSEAGKDAGLPGRLVTIALLSLGAPFWFNQLKNLSNLRSVVAAKEEKEREEAAASTTTVQPNKQAIGSTAERNEGEVL